MRPPALILLVAAWLGLLGVAELLTLWQGLAWLHLTAHALELTWWAARTAAYLAASWLLGRQRRVGYWLACLCLAQIWGLYLSPLARFEVDWDLRRWWSLVGLVVLAVYRRHPWR